MRLILEYKRKEVVLIWYFKVSFRKKDRFGLPDIYVYLNFALGHSSIFLFLPYGIL